MINPLIFIPMLVCDIIGWIGVGLILYGRWRPKPWLGVSTIAVLTIGLLLGIFGLWRGR